MRLYTRASEWLRFRLTWVSKCENCEHIRLDAETARWEIEQLRGELVRAYADTQARDSFVDNRPTTPVARGVVYP